MKAAVISLGSKSSQMTVESMKNVFSSVDDINLKSIEVSVGREDKPVVLYEGKPLPKYDCVYAKGSFRYAPILRSLAEALEGTTYMPIKPGSFIAAHDKILTHLAFQRKNIPMPVTYLASSAAAGKNILNEVNYPIVLKFPHGTQGIGVMIADSYGSASSMLDALLALKQPFLIQEYIDTDGVDIRAFVIGKKVVGAVKRKAKRGEMRANVHTGGQGEAVVLDSQTRRVALDAAAAIGADICAIDILQGPKGPLVIEANVSPGLQGITEMLELDVAGKIASYLYDKAKEFKEKGDEKGTEQMMQELGIEKPHAQQIISHLNFRGDRILLPKVITDLTGFTESDEFVIKVENKKVIIERS